MPPSNASTTPRQMWKQCYRRFRYARRYHDPTDPDADWTRSQIHAAAAVLQRLIARRRP